MTKWYNLASTLEYWCNIFTQMLRFAKPSQHFKTFWIFRKRFFTKRSNELPSLSYRHINDLNLKLQDKRKPRWDRSPVRRKKFFAQLHLCSQDSDNKPLQLLDLKITISSNLEIDVGQNKISKFKKRFADFKKFKKIAGILMVKTGLEIKSFFSERNN